MVRLLLLKICAPVPVWTSRVRIPRSRIPVFLLKIVHQLGERVLYNSASSPLSDAYNHYLGNLRVFVRIVRELREFGIIADSPDLRCHELDQAVRLLPTSSLQRDQCSISQWIGFVGRGRRLNAHNLAGIVELGNCTEEVFSWHKVHQIPRRSHAVVCERTL